MDLLRIGDELEIVALLNRYARAVDTKDWELYRSVFTDDAHIDYSAKVFQGSLDGVIEFFTGAFSELVTMSMHYITNVESDHRGRHRAGAGDVLQPDAVQGRPGDRHVRRLLLPRPGSHAARLAQQKPARGDGVDGQLTPC
jgi:SnoaL-like domain